MADDKEAEAKRVIARQILWHTASSGVIPTRVDYPDLTQEQWYSMYQRLFAVVDSLRPTQEEFHAAYEFLTGKLPG